MDKTDNKVRIRMTETVRGFAFAPAGTILRAGKEYDGESNRNGEISGYCANGQKLGVKPGEFEFIEAPEWVIRIWRKMR